MFTGGLTLLSLALSALATSLERRQSAPLDACPGYAASNVRNNGASITADLTLAGTPCNVYGQDLINLRLLVEYQDGTFSVLQLACLHGTNLIQRADFTSRSTMRLNKSTRSRSLSGPDLPVATAWILHPRSLHFRGPPTPSRSPCFAESPTRRSLTVRQPRSSSKISMFA
jgi:hypothetical protein